MRVMSKYNNTIEMLQQYGTASNLNIRIALHQLYSTNKTGWSNWVFQQYCIQPNMTVLELGCGGGMIWKQHASEIPSGVQLILSDFSEGMLASAKENTSSLDSVRYEQIDAQNIPYDDHTVDRIIANHMLYHVPDVQRAIHEIARVLKPSGIFYATTIGEKNFKELIDLLHAYDPKIDFAQGSIVEAFGLETGLEKLSPFFESVQVQRYIDHLHITEPQPLIDYVLSSAGIGNVNNIICGERVAAFSEYIEHIFEQQGYIDIHKEAGIFICTKKDGDK